MIRTRPTVTAIAAIACVTAFLSAATPSAQAPRRVALVGGMLLTGYEVPTPRSSTPAAASCCRD
jgi:hypothetical protein